ncbi:sensor domain-containing diguanylate cyclase [Bosea sp. PAMC 26642]|uniref:sensor domain-containing diguanylate cyclase n=1 Tax=Bosea sp. (strain PAMC 26642) TaxID=1792307 RepID=UPI0009E962F8|nr:sensor domain-containing diguanylate cyclase [Bosea sp. PAMC 26642]
MSSEIASIAHAKRLYDQAAGLARIGAWECDLATTNLTWTDGVYDLFGFKRGTTLHRPSTVDLYHDTSRARMERLRATMIGTGQGFTLDARIRTTSGIDRWMRLSADIAHEHGRPVRIFGAKQDITHEKEMWDALARMAHRDPLTGLANRPGFDAAFRDAAFEDDRTTALVVVDLDRFATINERFGRTAGDECLRQISGRLERIFGDAMLVARIGEDEFAILLRLPSSHSQLAPILNAALQLLSRPLKWNNHSIEVPLSIGATILTPTHRDDPTKLFAEADSALLLAKTAGRRRVRIFDGAVEDALPPRKPQTPLSAGRFN